MEKFVNNLMRHMASKESNWTAPKSSEKKTTIKIAQEEPPQEKTFLTFEWETNLLIMKIEGSSDVGDKTTPKDALVMAAILRDMGITEYEPRVINQVPDLFQIF